MKKRTRLDLLAAFGLGTGYVAALVSSVGTLGYARDEGFYFYAASAYGRWFSRLATSPSQALDPAAVDAAWSVNHEHPALLKSLFALSHSLLFEKWRLFSMAGTSFRFPAMVLAGLLVAIVYLWGAEVRSRTAGLAAALAIAWMPRVFFHAHLACFDVPVVAMWTLGAFAYRRAIGGEDTTEVLRGGQWRKPLWLGLVFGLLLNTKHNAWFLPIVAATHVAGLGILRALAAKRASAAWEDPRVKRGLVALAAMATIGPLVLYATWPWIWHDTLKRLKEYALFHLQHDYYNMELFGVTYWKPPMPRAYAPVMTIATVPAITLLLFAAGLFGRLRQRAGEALSWLGDRPWGKGFGAEAPHATGAPSVYRRIARRIGAPRASLEKRGPDFATELLWLLSIGAIYAAWLSPTTPIFGGTKHWMTAYPFVALFAGIGADDAVRALKAAVLRRRRMLRDVGKTALRIAAPATGIVAMALFTLAPLAETWHAHPWGLSAYTPLAGGASGAATLGLNRTFWGYTTGSVVPYLNTLPEGESVYLHDTLGPSWDMLVADGRLQKHMRVVGSTSVARTSLYHHEPHMLGQEYQAWVVYGTVKPAHIAGIDGVPVIWIYRRK